MSSSTSTSRHQNQLQQQKQDLETSLEEQRSPELEGYQADQEFDSERAARLQPHYGNHTVQDLLTKLNDVDNAISEMERSNDLDMVEEVEEDEEFDMEDELDFSGFGGGGGVGSGATSENPWEFEVFYGGDDDDSPAALRRRQRRIKLQNQDFQMPSPEKEKEPLKAATQISHILPTPLQGHREGDARYQAPEIALFNPDLLYGQSLDPGDLANRTGRADPIRTPVEIGRFLSKQPTSLLAQSIGEILGGPAAALVIPQGGFSTACARLATLAVCAEAALAPQYDAEMCDAAVHLSLRVEVWPQTITIAEKLATKGQLNAPAIFISSQKSAPTDEHKLPFPSQLGGAALQNILPPPPYVSVPHLRIIKQPLVELDNTLALIEATMAKFTKGSDPDDPTAPQTLNAFTLQPALQTCNELLSALGRAQVEFAAAANAISMIKENAPMLSTLRYSDAAMKDLALAVIRAGKKLERSKNKPLHTNRDIADKAIEAINETRKAFLSLRTWAFSTIAGGLNVS